MKDKKIKKKLKKPLEDQIIKYGLKCDDLVIPIYQRMIDSINFLSDNMFFKKRDTSKYIYDLAERIHTHLTAWNQNVKMKIE